MSDAPEPPPAPRHYVAPWRKVYGWTQAELADRAGVHVSTIAKVEQDQTNLSPQLLSKLSEVFELDKGMILSTDPKRVGKDGSELLRLFARMSAPQRQQLLDMAKTFPMGEEA